MPQYMHRRSSTVQEEGLTNEGRHHLLLLRKQAHDKRDIEEILHAQITRARLTACEVGVFSREISQLWNRTRDEAIMLKNLPFMLC